MAEAKEEARLEVMRECAMRKASSSSKASTSSMAGSSSMASSSSKVSTVVEPVKSGKQHEEPEEENLVIDEAAVSQSTDQGDLEVEV